MSLNDPRPKVPFLIVQFNKEILNFINRLLVTLGICDIAQVNGVYEASAAEKLLKDIQYIEKRKISLYICIFILTIKTVLTGNEAR